MEKRQQCNGDGQHPLGETERLGSEPCTASEDDSHGVGTTTDTDIDSLARHQSNNTVRSSERRTPPLWLVIGAVTLTAGTGLVMWGIASLDGPEAPVIQVQDEVERGGLNPVGLATARPLTPTAYSSVRETTGVLATAPAEVSDRVEGIEAVLSVIRAKYADDHAETRRALDLQTEQIRMLTQTLTEMRERTAPLERRLDELATTLGPLKTQVTELKVATSAPPEPARPKTQPTPKPKPRVPPLPFRIVAIDRWGDDLQAAIQHQGEMRFLKIGESRAGWILNDIDWAKGTATFVSRTGFKRTTRASG